MIQWREWKIGDNIRWSWTDKETGDGTKVGRVIEVANDHAVVQCGDTRVWVDDKTPRSEEFRKVSCFEI